MTKKYFVSAVIMFVLLHSITAQSPRTTLNFNSGWKFLLGNDSNAISPSYNDADWRKIDLPHDWSIESNFMKDAPATNQGGSLPGGIGWYRKTFWLPSSAKEKNVHIEFDGVYKNSEVWINGHYLGRRPYGYVNFSYDLTPYLFFDKQNVMAVKVDNSLQPDSRWYSGSGIYRDVKLVMFKKWITKPADFFIHTEDSGTGDFKVIAESWQYSNSKVLSVDVYLYDNKGKMIGSMDNVIFNKDNYFKSAFKISKPLLWSPSAPVLYKAVFKVFMSEYLVDEYETTFGIRSFRFDSQKGFFLNNKPLKIHGVCLHHDLGALGAAFNKSAASRQLRILKDMGCNAIRFSHNPPAAAMLDLCDEMGFLVIDEAYDIWKKKKNKFDYHLYFDEWAVKDVQAMVQRDRNHPSVILWSIGNEQREQFDSTGTSIVTKLVAAVKEEDGTRPVTTALTETFPEKNFITKAGALDVLGFNYKLFDYEALPERFPNQKFIATETASALETRGVYNLPSDSIRIWPPDYKAQDTFSNINGNKDYTASAYDNTHAYWGATHEKNWLAVKRNAHISGLFVWSGFDYLGEPLPYAKFPARSSYYGIIDLAGFPKDVYYMYQSEWTNKNVLHLFPHWNWTKGDTVDVWAYYNNADEVELYLNGKSLGKRNKTDSTLHVMWRVPFKAGILKAVSKKNGKTVLTKEIRTAGAPYKIQLLVERKKIKFSENELAFITALITDRQGSLVTGEDRLIQFSVSGNGVIAGTDNGYQADTVSLKSPRRNTWKGMALAIIQPAVKKGNITVNASALGLKPATITLEIAD